MEKIRKQFEEVKDYFDLKQELETQEKNLAKIEKEIKKLNAEQDDLLNNTSKDNLIKQIDEVIQKIKYLKKEETLQKFSEDVSKKIELFSTKIDDNNMSLCLRIDKIIVNSQQEQFSIVEEKIENFLKEFDFIEKIYKSDKNFYVLGKDKKKSIRVSKNIEDSKLISFETFFNFENIFAKKMATILLSDLKDKVFMNNPEESFLYNFNEKYFKNTQYYITNMNEFKIDVFIKNLLKITKQKKKLFQEIEKNFRFRFTFSK